MARPEDIPEPTRSLVATLGGPRFDTRPFVAGPKLAERRIAILSSAALVARGTPPFLFGSADYLTIPADRPAAETLTSHVSINHDRSGFQRDINTVFPIDRLRELAAEGAVGSVADTHYTVMGSSDPAAMVATADGIAGQLRRERVDSVLLSPV